MYVLPALCRRQLSSRTTRAAIQPIPSDILTNTSHISPPKVAAALQFVATHGISKIIRRPGAIVHVTDLRCGYK